MRIHWEESATTKTAPFRRNPSGAGGPPTYQTEAAGAPQALSGIGKAGLDEKTAPAASVSNLGARSSLRARNPKTPARGPRDFCHGLLARPEVLLLRCSFGDQQDSRAVSLLPFLDQVYAGEPRSSQSVYDVSQTEPLRIRGHT